MSDTINELERDAESPSKILVEELRRVKVVRPWRMPVGFKVRMASKFLATTLRGGLRLVAALTAFVKDNGLQNSVYGKELVRGAETVDLLLHDERVVGFIN